MIVASVWLNLLLVNASAAAPSETSSSVAPVPATAAPKAAPGKSAQPAPRSSAIVYDPGPPPCLALEFGFTQLAFDYIHSPCTAKDDQTEPCQSEYATLMNLKRQISRHHCQTPTLLKSSNLKRASAPH
jgi:hypothetical protein